LKTSLPNINNNNNKLKKKVKKWSVITILTLLIKSIKIDLQTKIKLINKISNKVNNKVEVDLHKLILKIRTYNFQMMKMKLNNLQHLNKGNSRLNNNLFNNNKINITKTLSNKITQW